MEEIASQIRGGSPLEAAPAVPRSTPDRSAPETYHVLKHLVRSIYPHAKFTSDKRTPEHNRAVGGVENSSHVSGHGLDVVNLTKAEREDLKSRLEALGIKFDEYRYHTVKKDGSGWHLHMATTHVPEELLAIGHIEDKKSAITGLINAGATLEDVYEAHPDLANDPSNRETVQSWIDARAASDADVSPSYSHKPQDPDSGPGFFDMPDSWGQFAQGLAQGTGNVVEGLADVPGIILDPINTMIGRALGYDGYVADFGKTVRESIGLPEDNSLTGEVVRGLSGGLSVSGGAKLATKAATSSLAKKALQELGSTPVRDAIGGAGAALGSGLTERAGASYPVQVAAAMAGGATGALGIERAAARGGKFLDGPTGSRVFPKAAQKRFEATQAANRYRAYDRQISTDVDKIVSTLTAGHSAKRKLTKDQKSLLVDRISDLERSYLPYEEIKALALKGSAKAKLRSALDKRHLLGDAEIDALADGTVAGDAVADAIRKARRLRSLVPEVAGRSNPIAGRFLAEALGGSLGYKLGGPLGSAAGAAAGRRLTGSAKSAADKALELSAQADKFAKMPGETWGKPHDPSAALSRLSDEARDAPFLAKEEAKRLEAENAKVGIRNALDDVKPSGGWRGLIYERVGLLPSQQDTAALLALRDKAISPEQFKAFLEAPDKLMQGNAGNALTDRFAAYADSGKLTRDPDWSPPTNPVASGSMVDAQGQPIRSLPAYQAGAAKNIARELQLRQELDEIDPVVTVLGEGPTASSIRLSEDPNRTMDAAARTRADAIRLELEGMKAKSKRKGE